MLTTCAACRARLQPPPQALQNRRLWELLQRPLQPQGRQQPHLVRFVMGVHMHWHSLWSSETAFANNQMSGALS